MTSMHSAVVDVLRNVAPFENQWNDGHRLLRNAFDPTTAPLTAQGVIDHVEHGTLRWPYFVMVSDGASVSPRTFVERRRVGPVVKDGFIDGDVAMRLVRTGVTFKLNSMRDWCGPARRLAAAAESQHGVVANVYGFYTPPGSRGLGIHSDDDHVVVMQVAGTKSWAIYAPGGPTTEDGRPLDQPAAQFSLSPGDIMYLPQGWPHRAECQDTTSWHLTLTMRAPSCFDVVDGVMRTWVDELASQLLPAGVRELPSALDRLRAITTTIGGEHACAKALAALRSGCP